MKFCKKIFKKLIYFLAVIYSIYLLTLGYFATLLIVKPRNLSFLDQTIEKSLQTILPDISLKTELLFLDWDKNHFSLNLKASNIEITHKNGFILSLPELTIDIDRIKLLFGKIVITQIKANNAIADLSNIAKKTPQITSDKSTSPKQHWNIHNDIIKLQKIIHNISFSHFIIKLDNLRQITSSLKFKSDRVDDKILTKINLRITSQHKNFFLKHNCSSNLTSGKINCGGQSNMINANFLHTLNIPKVTEASQLESLLNYTIKSDINKLFEEISFNLNSTKPGRIEIAQISDQIPFSSLKLEGKINDKINLKFNSKLINSATVKGNIAIANHPKIEQAQSISLNIATSDSNLTELKKLWPLNAASKLRKYIVNNLEAQIDKLNLSLTIDKIPTRKKPKLTNLGLMASFHDGEIKYSKLFPKISNISGQISADNHLLKITSAKAMANEVTLENISVKIPEPLRKKKEVFIESQIIGHPNSHILYLLEKALPSNTLKNLTKILALDGAIKGRVALNLPIKKKPQITDINILANLELADFSFADYLTDSKLTLTLNKSKQNTEFTTGLDCKSCNLAFNTLNYQKQQSDYHKISANWSIIAKEVKLHNISFYENELLKITAKGDITKNGFSDVLVKISELGQNNLNVAINQKAGNSYINLDGESLDLGQIIQVIASKKNGKNNIINGSIEQVILPNGNKLQQANFASKYTKKGDLISFINAKFNDKQNFININRKTTEKKERITIETDNFGEIASSLQITDRIIAGKLHLELSKKRKEKGYHGKLRANNFSVKEIPFLNTIKKLDIFKNLRKKLATNNMLDFEQAKGNFTLGDKLTIKHFAAYSEPLGITSKGKVYFSENRLELNGVLVPAYQINRLFGLADIPYLGKIITGGEDAGIISPRYKIKGSFDNNKFEINPLSAATPGLLRNIFNFSLGETMKKTEKCLENISDNKLKSLTKPCL